MSLVGKARNSFCKLTRAVGYCVSPNNCTVFDVFNVYFYLFNLLNFMVKNTEGPLVDTPAALQLHYLFIYLFINTLQLKG